jgi:hypothetical protein
MCVYVSVACRLHFSITNVLQLAVPNPVVGVGHPCDVVWNKLDRVPCSYQHTVRRPVSVPVLDR